MRAYIIRRLLLMIPTLFIVTIVTFLSVRFIPGDAIDAMTVELEMLGFVADREALEKQLGLDVPFYVQYGRWMGGILLHGTLGEPLWGGVSIEERILARLPVTIELGVLAILIGLVIAVLVGIYSAMRRNSAADYVGRAAAVIGLATPNFWLALMVIIYPALWWGWSPPMRLVSFAKDPLGNLEVFIIPKPDPGHGSFCRHNATDPDDDAGGAEAGLYQDGVVQGSPGAGRHHETRHQERPHSGGYPDRPAVAYPGWWLRYHGEHLQPARTGSPHSVGARRTRLPGGLGGKPVFRNRGGLLQSDDRPDLSFF